jgi:hypothetical protein
VHVEQRCWRRRAAGCGGGSEGNSAGGGMQLDAAAAGKGARERMTVWRRTMRATG